MSVHKRNAWRVQCSFSTKHQSFACLFITWDIMDGGWIGVNANVLIDDGGNYKSIIRKSLYFKHIFVDKYDKKKY